jgi:aconitate hydratase
LSIAGPDTLNARRSLSVGGKEYDYFSLSAAAAAAGLGDVSRLPFSLKVLLENVIRFADGRTVTAAEIGAFARWLDARSSSEEIAFRPARVLLQDFTGVPALVDLAAMRATAAGLGGDPKRINPSSPVDLVIDHSVIVDSFARPDSFRQNIEREFARNRERYAFLKWGRQAFANLRVVPPDTGICHQINLEYLARVVWTADAGGRTLAYPDTLVGADSHTPMVNGLAVLGWGVGGIEAEAVMLGQPISMVLPEVIGMRLHGALREGVTATDLVLTLTELLRKKGAVGRFVEYFGPGLASLSVPERAPLGNMSPEMGATCGFFPIDRQTLDYLAFTDREPQQVALVEAYAKAQGLWRDDNAPDPIFTDILDLDLGNVEASVAGPSRPQDRVRLGALPTAFAAALPSLAGRKATPTAGREEHPRNGDVVIAAITSCTNTSNPSVMLAAGLLARNAVRRGLRVKPWVKTSLAPGSQVVSDYFAAAGLQAALDELGFNLVGYGCTTCIGNSGPLPEPIAKAVEEQNLVVAAVLSGNRNFEGRIHPLVRASYLMSPPLVVAYALAGSVAVDLEKEPLGRDREGALVYLRDLWPSAAEAQETIARALSPDMFTKRYAEVSVGPPQWRDIAVAEGGTYRWDAASTYVAHPPFFDRMERRPPPLADIIGARPLAILGDSVTTDHISPAGFINPASPAGKYLIGCGVSPAEFNSYGARRGNHEVMMRGTFANPRIKNEMVPGREGGVTRHLPDGEVTTIYEAAMRYREEGVPLLVIAGREYGSGSSRDWAAKGPQLLGVKAVFAESYERIHRSNLIGMGLLPLQFKPGEGRQSLQLDGSERFDVLGLASLQPGCDVSCRVHRSSCTTEEIRLLCRIDTTDELDYFRHGGILNYVLRHELNARS